jgi:hypothetical protein
MLGNGQHSSRGLREPLSLILKQCLRSCIPCAPYSLFPIILCFAVCSAFFSSTVTLAVCKISLAS